MDGILAATFVKLQHEPGFKPDKEYLLESTMVTPDNAAQMYDKFTAAP